MPLPSPRPFRYDLNQIPYDYTLEVRNRFKGLDLIDRVPDEPWMEVRDTVRETKDIFTVTECQGSPEPGEVDTGQCNYLCGVLRSWGGVRQHWSQTA